MTIKDKQNKSENLSKCFCKCEIALDMSDASRIQEELNMVKGYPRRFPAYFFYIAGIAREKTKLSGEIILKLLEKYHLSLFKLDETSQAEIESFICEGELAKARELMAREPPVNIEENALKLIEELRNEEMMLKSQIVLEQKPSVRCNMCLEGLEMSGCVIPENCGHMFHNQCILTHAQKAMNEAKLDIKCPDNSCVSALTVGDIKTIGLLDLYEQMSLKQFLAAEDMLTCPVCNETMSVENPNIVVCPFCKNTICGKCKNLSATCSCPKNRYVIETRQCPQCNNWNRKEQGGRLFQCQKCHVVYCFECGAFDLDCVCG